MIALSATTLIVILANTLTAIVSTMLLLLVFWQNPRHLLNRIFAIAMMALTSLSISNIIGRFTGELALDPTATFYMVNTFYAIFVFSLLLYAAEVAGLPPVAIRWLVVAVLGIGFISLALMWGGYADRGITASAEGNYRTEYNLLGYLNGLLLFSILLISTLLLYQNRHQTPHAQSLWMAPSLIVGGALWALFIWPMFQFPANALALAGAAIILGRAVLLERIFDPLARYSAELATKNQELVEVNRIKSQFMSNISHELRTPLNNIIGYTDLIMSGTYGDTSLQQADRLQKVIRNARHLLALVNDILDLARIEAGRIKLAPETVDTQELLENVLTSLAPQIADRQLPLIREFADAPPIVVDRLRAQQIFTNIIGNAVKFTHQGHIRIRAYEHGTSVRFEIEDTGIGIPTDKQSLVFEEFRQVDNTPTREYGGTGLGMPITKRLVEMSGGAIWFTSKAGEGTTFYVTLPQVLIERTTELPMPQVPATLEGETATKVLVIDDSRDSQILLRDTIQAEKANFRVMVAGSGQDGLRLAKDFRPDIITLDVMMPNFDGWEVLKALKADADLSRVPVILVSVIDNHRLAYQMGASAIVEKPIERSVFLQALEQVLVSKQIAKPS